LGFPIPLEIKLYHILHIDKLPHIISDQALYTDSKLLKRAQSGTVIGMNKIKKRRLEKLTLSNYPNLHVGDCVPFYFCPRSVMLYIFHKDNHPEIDYHGGQEPIIHLEADLNQVVDWANRNGKRWVFTLSNAGAYYFEDRADLEALNEINWTAVNAEDWRTCGEAKQAEFLIEDEFPISLFQRIGVFSNRYLIEVNRHLTKSGVRPRVEIKTNWYY
jgi:hypothetical protein